MKIKLFLILLTSVSFGFNPGNIPQFLEIKLTVSPTYEKLTLEILSEKSSLTDCQFKIMNEKGEEVKLINIPKANNNIATIINIEDLEVGEYTYTIIRNQKQLFKSHFKKDWFDADLL